MAEETKQNLEELQRVLACTVRAVAHDGNAAIATLAAERFDAVLSDVRMPGQDGIAVFHWIAAHRPGKRSANTSARLPPSDQPSSAAPAGT